MVRRGEWLVIETCLDMAQTLTRRRPSFPPRRRVDATLDGVSLARRISLALALALAVVDAAPSASATTLFTREAFSLSSLQPQLTLALALVLTLSHLQLRILSSSILRLISHSHPNFTLLPRTLASPESPSCGQASKVRHGSVSVETSTKPREFQAGVVKSRDLDFDHRKKKIKNRDQDMR